MQYKLILTFEMNKDTYVTYLLLANLFNPPPGIIDKSLLPSIFPKPWYIFYEKYGEACSKSKNLMLRVLIFIFSIFYKFLTHCTFCVKIL